MRIFDYLFGTAQRFWTTMTIIGVVVVISNPGLLRNATDRLVAELSPLLPLFLMAGAIYLIFFGRRRR